MAPMKTLNSNQSSSNYGEDTARQANVLASCYGPSGIPEVPFSGLPSPPSSPPLAAITSSNELALTPKPAKRQSTASNSESRRRRGGATLRIREECERFFCETMATTFFGERNGRPSVSGLTGVYQQHDHPANNNSIATNAAHRRPSAGSSAASRQQFTPPCDGSETACDGGRASSNIEVTSWMEIWDYQGGASFRAFTAEDYARGEKTLFTFFDAGVVGRDLKDALVALMELAEAPLGCSQLAICIDRSIETDEAKTLTKGLRWAGLELMTLDQWAGAIDVTSKEWVFMGTEV
ncbi:ornithine decarboxylase antizyme-domain-containing protein [Diaporthe sp. PMI_573]|nr:ornithine decarboxylase antizyme-domain-containing protein [Diaporthaceae sp. PMI_573]